MVSVRPYNMSRGLLRPARVLCLLFFWMFAAAARAESPADLMLPNGLRVLVHERHASSLVAIELWVRAGAREEGPEETGAAHFLEHTLFKGTKTRGVGDVDIAIENFGATLNASTGPDYSRFYTCVASEHAADALLVVADVVRNATLPESEVERERQVIRDELAQRDSDAGSLLIDHLYGAAFAGRPYGRPPGGTETVIRSRSRDSLAAFYRRTYTPERCILVLVGDLTPEQARPMAERAFGDWKISGEGGQPPAAGSIAAESRTPNPNSAVTLLEARRMQKEADIARPIVGVACLAPAAVDGTMACAAQIVAAMLGQSDVGGRLAVPGLGGSEARVRFAPRRDTSLFILSAVIPLSTAGRIQSRSEIADAAVAQEHAVAAVMDSLQSAPPTLAELSAAKNALLGRMIFENETNTGLAAALGGGTVTGGLLPEAWRSNIEKITLAEVRQFIAHWLDPAHRISLILLPRSANGTSEVRP